MKKIILVMTLLFSFLSANSALIVKQGWQLIGVSNDISDMSKFTKENVLEVWSFDASTQKWVGYSPDEAILKKMADKDIALIKTITNAQGFWVKSQKEWVLELKDKTYTQAPNQENDANDIISLKKGWNLISLPVDSVVSADIFKDMVVWKYNHNRDWEFFDSNKEEEKAEDLPSLGHIKNSDGLWVKAKEDTKISVMKEASKLHNFASTKEMEAYIKEMSEIYRRPICGIEPFFSPFARGGVDAVLALEGAVPVANVTSDDLASSSGVASKELSSTKNATSTNLQEKGVDEADILKHNGTNIFYISTQNYQDQHINITTFDNIKNGKTKPINTISFNKRRNISEMYLLDNKLVVLSSNDGYNYLTYADEVSTLEPEIDVKKPSYDRYVQQIVVDIFDVSDVLNVKNIANYKIDGYKVTSRVLDSKLYLVSTFTPQVNVTYPKVDVVLPEVCKAYFSPQSVEEFPRDVNIPLALDDGFYEQGSNDATTSQSVTAVEPKEATQTKAKVLAPDSYYPCYGIQQDYKTKTYYRYNYEAPIVEVLDLLPNIEGTALKSQDLVTPSRLYAPAKQQQQATMTTISQFNIKEAKYVKSNSFMGYSSTQYASSNALYLVSNEYPIYYNFNNYKTRSVIYKFNFDEALSYRGLGEVYGTPLNQYSLSEYKDILRIATTEGFSWGGQGTTNSIYTLKELESSLPIQGVLSGLGKENETIKAVRFMGDRAYVVTFLQTDPFYTIDMSDPQVPRKVGELKVKGYSGYLHPVGEDKILGIGRDADDEGRTKGMKLELFDISDFANPTSLDTVYLGDNSNSQIEYNPRILAYRASDNIFAFPYNSYGNRANNYQNTNYLGVWQVVEKTLKTYKPLASKLNNYGQSRGIIFDDNNNTTYTSLFVGDEIIVNKLEEK